MLSHLTYFWHSPAGKQFEKKIMILLSIVAAALAFCIGVVLLLSRLNVQKINLRALCARGTDERRSLSQCPNGDIVVSTLPADSTYSLVFSSQLSIYNRFGFLISQYHRSDRQTTFLYALRKVTGQSTGCRLIDTINYCETRE